MGRVLAPYGVVGWIRVAPFSAAPTALLEYPDWWLAPRGSRDWRAFRNLGGREHGGALVVRLEGVETREAAQALTGAEVAVPRAALPKARRGEIYCADLVGLAVTNRQGVALGTVLEVVEHGAHPLLRLAGEGPGARERLVPYVDAYVEAVDLESGRIEVDWPEDY